jgi:hypothetical protein
MPNLIGSDSVHRGSNWIPSVGRGWDELGVGRLNEGDEDHAYVGGDVGEDGMSWEWAD